jgi:malate synthase
MVETIQQIHKTHTQTKGSSTSMEGWNTTWLGMPNVIPLKAQKYQEVVISQENWLC